MIDELNASESLKVEAYCVKCRAKATICQIEYVTMKNGRPAAKGKCEKCGTGVFKIMKKEKANG